MGRPGRNVRRYGEYRSRQCRRIGRRNIPGSTPPNFSTFIPERKRSIERSIRFFSQACAVGQALYQRFDMGFDFRLRLSGLGVLRVLQLVLFLRDKSARVGDHSGGGVDFVSISCHGGAFSIWGMVFRSRGPEFWASTRTPDRSVGRHEAFRAAPIFRESHNEYFFCAPYDCLSRRIPDVRGGKLLGYLQRPCPVSLRNSVRTDEYDGQRGRRSFVYCHCQYRRSIWLEPCIGSRRGNDRDLRSPLVLCGRRQEPRKDLNLIRGLENWPFRSTTKLRQRMDFAPFLMQCNIVAPDAWKMRKQKRKLVDVTGFEPATPCLQRLDARRINNLHELR